MLHQGSASWADAEARVGRVETDAVAALAYRSRAVLPVTGLDLDQILAEAQVRNSAAGLTGLLVYDRGRFFQWLEGPAPALSRVWSSIRRDTRHTDIELLRRDRMPKRFFATWDMRLARCKKEGVEKLSASVDTPQELLKQIRGSPSAIAGARWNLLFSEVVIPRLHAKHGGAPEREPARPASSGAIGEWARRLLAGDDSDCSSHTNQRMERGAELGALYGEVFEPMQRHLGDLCEQGQCNEYQLSMALARLHIGARRLGAEFPARAAALSEPRSVLLAATPSEFHAASTTMTAELFLRHGWEVSCESLGSENAVNLVAGRFFDAMVLSSSAALRCVPQPDMRSRIEAIRSASLNPALVVIVDGRACFEQPGIYARMGADAQALGASACVQAAHRLVELAKREPAAAPVYSVDH